MTYEEIKAKYAPKVTEKRTSEALAQSKVERIEAQIAHYTQEREQYRQRNGVITAHNASQWRQLTQKINSLNEKRNEAAAELARIQGGDAVADAVTTNL